MSKPTQLSTVEDCRKIIRRAARELKSRTRLRRLAESAAFELMEEQHDSKPNNDEDKL